MEKIKDYQIVEASSPSSMTGKVTALIQEGWQPYYGPLSCINVNGNRVLLQAMVMPETACLGAEPRR